MSVALTIRTQTPQSVATYAIPYVYVLTTGSGSTTLASGRHTIRIRAQHLTLERGPSGERREADLPSQEVSLTYELTPTPLEGFTRVVLEIAPGANVRFQIQVREKIQSGELLFTSREVEIVSRQERLPSEYFKHISECSVEQSRLFGHVNQKYAISEVASGLPSFDPRRHSPAEYLAELQRGHPEELRRELASIERFR